MKPADPATAVPTLTPHRWRSFAVLALVQLMLILDTTVVNVALPTIRDGLHFSQVGMAWVINGYALAAGGLLVLGGRLGDLLGRRRIFLVGVAVFAIASLACGAAAEPWQLVAGRFAQGVGTALATPAALALVSLLFPEGPDRIRALSWWGGLAGLGGTAGVLLSGVLIEIANWRWVFLINLPIAALALLLVPRLINADPVAERRDRLDLPGAILLTLGLVSVIDGVLRAAEDGWAAGGVIARLAGGGLLLLGFLVVEARTARPLVPLTFFRDRTRATSYAAAVIASSAMAVAFYFVTLLLQDTRGLSALQTGIAWVPFGVVMLIGLSIAGPALRILGIRWALALAFSVSAAGVLMLSILGPNGDVVLAVIPGTLLLALGTGMAFPVIQGAALHATSFRDAGLASGVQATVANLGGSLGLALFVALAAARLGDGSAGGQSPASAHASSTVFLVAGIILLAGAVLAAIFVRNPATTIQPLPKPLENAGTSVEQANISTEEETTHHGAAGVPIILPTRD